MILSRGRSYLFIHIPKTGGTALALALEARAMADDMMLGDTPKALKRRRRLKDVATSGRLWKHSTLADLEGLLPPDEMRALFTFTMVRNPWDRVVSYYHWLKTQSFDHPAVALARRYTFADFLQQPHVQRSLLISPAPSYVTGSDGVERCDLYIRLEHFQRDAQPLFAHLGFDFELPQVNQSTRSRDWRPYYNDHSCDLVQKLCQTEIERFEYSFNDLPLTRL